MLRLALFAATVIMRMQSARLRWRRFVRGARNSLPYSRSSQPTKRRPTLSGPRLDPYRTGHVSECLRCGVEEIVPLAICRFERHPWRLVWNCLSCAEQTSALVHAEVIPFLLRHDVAGGLVVSAREAAFWERADADDVTEAFVEELL